MKNKLRFTNIIAVGTVLFCALILTQTNFAQSDCKAAAAHFAKGMELLAANLEGKAEPEFSLYIACEPGKADGYSQRAYAKVRNTMWTWYFDSALVDISKALELNSKDSTAYLVRGMISNEKKHYDEAIKDFSEAIRVAPAMDESYIYRGYAYASLQQFDKAIVDISRAIELKPNAGLYDERGLIYTLQKNFAAAVDDYKHALTLDPADGDAKNGLQATLSKAPIADADSALTPGEYIKISEKDPTVVAAANYAFTVNAKTDPTFDTITAIRINAIQRAERQNRVGTKYELCMEIAVKNDPKYPNKFSFKTTIFYSLDHKFSVKYWGMISGICNPVGLPPTSVESRASNEGMCLFQCI